MSRSVLIENPLIPKYKTVKYKHDIILSENTIIVEALSSFDNQYKVANLLSKIGYEMAVNGVNKNYIPLKDEFPTLIIKGANLEVKISKYNDIGAQFVNLNKDGDVNILIWLPCSFKLQNQENIIKNLISAISHELMHGYVFLSRYYNEQEINDAPNNYQEALEIIHKSDGLIYDYAYAIYSTYYQEVQAFVPQTTPYFRKLFYKNNLTNNEIEDGIKKCESYLIYSNIINKLIPYLINLSDEELEKEITIPIKNQFGFNWDIPMIKKSLKSIEQQSKKALYKIMKNAMLISKIENENE